MFRTRPHWSPLQRTILHDGVGDLLAHLGLLPVPAFACVVLGGDPVRLNGVRSPAAVAAPTLSPLLRSLTLSALDARLSQQKLLSFAALYT